MSTEEIANRRQTLNARSARKGNDITNSPRRLTRMGLKRKSRWLKAIESSGGHIGLIAQIMGCKPYTIHLLLNQARQRPAWQKVIERYDFECGKLVRQALQNMEEATDPERNPDIDSRAQHSRWVLERRDPRFANKQTTTIEGGDKPLQTVNHNLNVLIQGMPPEMQRQLLEQMDAQEERVRKADLRPVDSMVVEQPKPKGAKRGNTKG